MQINPISTSGTWEWQSGDLDCRAQFILNAAEPSGTLTWVEDLDPFGDKSGIEWMALPDCKCPPP